MPKGAILTHANAVAALVGPKLMGAIDGTPGDTILSFLPLAHIYERENVNMCLYAGMRIGFFHGEVTGLVDDIQKLQPTIITLVPRVLSKIASAIQSATIDAEGIRGRLSRTALAAKYARMDGPQKTFHHPIWDRLWSRKIRQVLGGKVRLIVSGSAPASPQTLKFLRAALACDVMEGYGLTETFASALLCLPGDFTPGHCGPLVPTIEARLKDVPDMGYTANDLPNPRGELQLRGHVIFKGYYKDEKKTKEAFEGDWFCTGDIVEIDDAGRIYIIDRVKNFFKVLPPLFGVLMYSWLKENIFLRKDSKIFILRIQLLVQSSFTATVRKPLSSRSLVSIPNRMQSGLPKSLVVPSLHQTLNQPSTIHKSSKPYKKT